MNFRSGVQIPEKSTLPSEVRGVAAGAAARFRVLSASRCARASLGAGGHDVTTTATMIKGRIGPFTMTPPRWRGSVHERWPNHTSVLAYDNTSSGSGRTVGK